MMSPGAMRVASFAEHLSEFGHEVVVLTTSNGYSSMLSSETLASSNVRVIRCRDLLPKKAFTIQVKSERSKKLRSRVIRFFMTFIPLDRDISWLPSVLSNKVLKGEKFDFVIGSYPYATNLLAAFFLSQKTHAKLILDMRDLWTDDPQFIKQRDIKRRIHEYCSKKIFAKAKGLISVSKHNNAVLGPRLADVAVKTCVIYNGINTSFSLNQLDRNGMKTPQFQIAYAGSFYGGGRNIAPFLKAIKRLYSEQLINHDSFSFDIYGNRDSYIDGVVEKEGVLDLVHCHGFLSQDALFDTLSKKNILLVLTRSDAKAAGELTTKVFEYITLGNAILCLTKPTFEICDLLENVALSHCVDVEDETLIYEYIKQEISKWKASGRMLAKRPPTEQFTRRKSSEKLECFLSDF